MADWIDLVDKKNAIRNILQVLDKHINASVDYPSELFEIKRELLESIDIEVSFFAQDSVNRWIPCSERLPEPLQNVIVCTDIKTVTVAWINGDCWHFADTGNGRIEFYGFDEVTHWMSIPEPPKG